MSNTIIEQIDSLVEELVLVREAISTDVEKVKDKDKNKDKDIPSDQEISMNVSGTDDLHKRDPELFAKMAKFYDPERKPFTASTWFMTGWSGGDTRPLKDIEIDGITYRQTKPHAMPRNDWYWIKQGVVDVTSERWLFPILPAGVSLSREMEVAYVKEYAGGLRFSMKNWPDHLREAYEETH